MHSGKQKTEWGHFFFFLTHETGAYSFKRRFKEILFFLLLCHNFLLMAPSFIDALNLFCRATTRPCGSDRVSGKRGRGPGEKSSPPVASAGLLLQLGLPWQQLHFCKQCHRKGPYVYANRYIDCVIVQPICSANLHKLYWIKQLQIPCRPTMPAQEVEIWWAEKIFAFCVTFRLTLQRCKLPSTD